MNLLDEDELEYRRVDVSEVYCSGCTAPLASDDRRRCPECDARLCRACETCYFDREDK